MVFKQNAMFFFHCSDGHQIKLDDVCSYAKGNMFWGEFNEKENGIKSVGFKLREMEKKLTMERSVLTKAF